MSVWIAKQNGNRPVCIFSRDPRLTAVLSSALGSEYPVVTALDKGAGCQLLTAQTGAALIDIGSISQKERDEALKQAHARGVPTIVVAGDENQDEAVRLVANGAYTYLRKPPALRELRGILRRVFEEGCPGRGRKVWMTRLTRDSKFTGLTN